MVGQNPVLPVNIPIPTKIGSKMGGAPTPKWDPIGVDPQPYKPHIARVRTSLGVPSNHSFQGSFFSGNHQKPRGNGSGF